MLRISRWISIAGLVCAAALTGTAALAQSPDWQNSQRMAWAPASGKTIGWYLGLGVGYNHVGNFTEIVGGTGIAIPTSDSALVAGSLGYKFANNVRLEFEVGHSGHNVVDPFNGHAAITTGMINGLYDINLTNNFAFSVGGGIGVAGFNYCTGFGAAPCTGGTTTGFAGQIIGEFSYAVTPSVAVFAQGRERFFAFDNSMIRDVNEQAGMVGVRWFVSR